MKRSCKDPFYIEVVLEYLLHMNLFKTAEVLKDECVSLKYPIDCFREALLCKLNKYFEDGELNLFFEVFNSAICEPLVSNIECKKLVVELHLYFASMSYFKAQSQPEDELSSDSFDGKRDFSTESPKIIVNNPDLVRHQLYMEELSIFLNRTCANLKNDPEFIPYFSLLSLPNPADHQLFKEMLQASKVSILKRRVKKFLLLSQPNKVPEIVYHLPSSIEKCNSVTVVTDEGSVVNKKPLPSVYQCNYQTSHNILYHVGMMAEKDDVNVCNRERNANYSSTLEGSKVKSGSRHVSTSCENENSMFEQSHDDLLMKKNRIRPITANETKTNNVFTSELSEEELESFRFLREKFNQLHCDYHNLIGVTSELTEALESCVRGKQVDLIETLNNCLQIFPDLFLHRYEKNDETKVSKGNFICESSGHEQKLHIIRIQRHLLQGNVKTRLLLLQALRWAVTKSSKQNREQVIGQFVTCDLLGLKDETLLKSLLLPPGVETPHPLQQMTARLLNTLASVKSGRCYLARNSVAVDIICAVLLQHNATLSDVITKNMLTAALQKLSLRRSQRTSMIHLGLVEWLFQNLSNDDLSSSYFLEYGTALLMNLCLHQSAKERCLPIAQAVFSILKDLLCTQVVQVLPYVNGTLYSLFSHPQLNEKAAEVGMAESLESNIKKQMNTEIIRQWYHILQFHKSMLLSESMNSFLQIPFSEGEMIDEDNEEIDLLGDDLDACDPVRNITGELIGEQLLRAHYTLPKQSFGCQEEPDLSNMEVNFQSFVLRPTSLHHKHQSTAKAMSEGFAAIGQTERSATKLESTANSDLSKLHIYGESSEQLKGKENQSSLKTQSFNRGAEVLLSAVTTEEVPLMSAELQEEVISKCDVDNDSDDVLVGYTLPNKEKCIENSKEFGNGDLNESGCSTENVDTTAFTSRPKIPRTPPHNM